MHRSKPSPPVWRDERVRILLVDQGSRHWSEVFQWRGANLGATVPQTARAVKPELTQPTHPSTRLGRGRSQVWQPELRRQTSLFIADVGGRF